MGRVDTFHTVANAVVSNDKPVAFEQGLVAPPTSDQFLVSDGITGIPFYVGEAMKLLVLETVTVQHKRVDNRLSTSLEYLIEQIIRKEVSSPQAIAQITESVIDNPRFIAPTATLDKSK